MITANSILQALFSAKDYIDEKLPILFWHYVYPGLLFAAGLYWGMLIAYIGRMQTKE